MSAESGAVAASAPTVVDVWAQPTLGGRPGWLGLPEIRRLFEKSGSADLMERPSGPDELVGLMDAAGVDVALLVD